MATIPVFPRPTAVGYCRVSTTEQAEHGWSIDQQEQAIRARAAELGLDLVAVFRDAGRSGRTLQRREGLLGLLELVHQRGIGVVLVKTQDRLSRAVDHALALRRWFHEHGTDLFFLDGGLHLRAAEVGRGGGDLSTALMASLIALLSEEEVNTLRRRIIPNLAAAAQAGKRGGRLPLGYCRGVDGAVQVERGEADLVAQAVAAVLAGTGVSRLARQWVAAGVRDATGAIISFDRLRGALTNPYLTGVLVYALPTLAVGGSAEGVAEVRIPGHHPALIDTVTFADLQQRVRMQARTPVETGVAQERRRQRRLVQRRATRLPKSGDLLAAVRPVARPVHGAVPPDLLHCDHCGGPMYASLQTVGGVDKRRQVAVYLCRYHKDRGAAFCPQPPVRCEVVDEAVFAALVAWWRDQEIPVEAAAGPLAVSGSPAGAAQPTIDPPAATSTSLAAAGATADRLRAVLAVAPTGVADRLRGRLAEAERAVAQLMTQAQREQAQRVEPRGPAWDLRRRPLAAWAALDVAGRRTAFSALVAGVQVRDKAVVAITARDAAGVAVPLPLVPQDAQEVSS